MKFENRLLFHESDQKDDAFESDHNIFFQRLCYWRKVKNCFNLYFVFIILQVRQANHLFPWWSTPKHDPWRWRWFDWHCSQRTSRFARWHQGKLIFILWLSFHLANITDVLNFYLLRSCFRILISIQNLKQYLESQFKL